MPAKLSLSRLPACLTLLLLALGAPACRHVQPAVPRVQTQADFDLQAYLGTWYEIASLPNPYQKGCQATEAHYAPGDKGRIKIVNACRKNSLTAPLTSVKGRGWRPHPERPAELKVQLFWPFVGDYWVIAHAPDYSWSVVGQPSRRYLWFLSRTRQVSEATLKLMRQAAEAQHYDLSRLSMTPQLQD